jgi:hypothetical protein
VWWWVSAAAAPFVWSLGNVDQVNAAWDGARWRLAWAGPAGVETATCDDSGTMTDRRTVAAAGTAVAVVRAADGSVHLVWVEGSTLRWAPAGGGAPLGTVPVPQPTGLAGCAADGGGVQCLGWAAGAWWGVRVDASGPPPAGVVTVAEQGDENPSLACGPEGCVAVGPHFLGNGNFTLQAVWLKGGQPAGPPVEVAQNVYLGSDVVAGPGGFVAVWVVPAVGAEEDEQPRYHVVGRPIAPGAAPAPASIVGAATGERPQPALAWDGGRLRLAWVSGQGGWTVEHPDPVLHLGSLDDRGAPLDLLGLTPFAGGPELMWVGPPTLAARTGGTAPDATLALAIHRNPDRTATVKGLVLPRLDVTR